MAENFGSYKYGGTAGYGSATESWNPFEVIGRMFNDLNGTSSKNQFTAEEAERARIFNSTEAQKARDFEERMSNTAYQRAVNDMRAAGINPASLSGVASSSPASVPSGVAASSSGGSAASGTSSGVLGALIGVLGKAAFASSKGTNVVKNYFR